MNTQLHGKSLIGASLSTSTESPFQVKNSATGELLEPVYHSASIEELNQSIALAEKAFPCYSTTPASTRAAFLRTIAENIASIVDDIVEKGTAETGLPEARLRGETARTTGQLNLFASLIEDGSWVDARIDTAIPDRQPLPKPDLRYMLQPLGPVAVFCASNFPLAFSVAGGDTASALASGCPVIVKAHHAHPGTAELVAHQIAAAVKQHNLPEGTFSLIYGSGRTIGTELVKHPSLKAVGFTGSRSGGRALFDLASARPEPIPVYAEMSSINPVFILPGAMKEKGENLATALHGSATLGVGQFCTNPGVVLTDGNSEFVEKLTELMKETPSACMLHTGIREAYDEGVSKKKNNAGVTTLTAEESDKGAGNSHAHTALFQTSVETWLKDESLADEVFGPSTLLIDYSEKQQLLDFAENLEGQLTASLFGTDEDIANHADLIAILTRKAGRLIINQFPTGVEVCHSMVHGGPYPATTDGRSTSVGSAAIFRFTRPVSYQNFPQSALPEELRDDNPRNIFRLIDGQLKK